MNAPKRRYIEISGNGLSGGTMKIFAMDDDTWFIGESAEACAEAYRVEYCVDYAADETFPHALDDAELDSHTYYPGGGDQLSFREQLVNEIADGGQFPRLFATSEF